MIGSPPAPPQVLLHLEGRKPRPHRPPAYASLVRHKHEQSSLCASQPLVPVHADLATIRHFRTLQLVTLRAATSVMTLVAPVKLWYD